MASWIDSVANFFSDVWDGFLSFLGFGKDFSGVPVQKNVTQQVVQKNVAAKLNQVDDAIKRALARKDALILNLQRENKVLKDTVSYKKSIVNVKNEMANQKKREIQEAWENGVKTTMFRGRRVEFKDKVWAGFIFDTVISNGKPYFFCKRPTRVLAWWEQLFLQLKIFKIDPREGVDMEWLVFGGKRSFEDSIVDYDNLKQLGDSTYLTLRWMSDGTYVPPVMVRY